jgi:hypothetical protein
VLAEFRARAERSGFGYQTLMNEALRAFLSKSDVPVTAEVLRHVLRQELPAYLAASGEATAKVKSGVMRPRRLA